MTITAKYASPCSTCHQTIQPGQQIEWTRGSAVRHTSCETARSAKPQAPVTSADATDFAHARACNMREPFIAGKDYVVEMRDGIAPAMLWTFTRISATEIACTARTAGYSWDGQTWIATVSGGKWFTPAARTERSYVDREDMLSMGYKAYATARPDLEDRVWSTVTTPAGPEQRRLYIQRVRRA